MHRSKPLWCTCKSRHEKFGNNTLEQFLSISGPFRYHGHETTNSFPHSSSDEVLSERCGIGDNFDGK